jgi:hypothetical protein
MTTSLAGGRTADSIRRRERVIKAISDTLRTGEEITVSGIARTARVDRTFLYRHRDLLEQVHIAEAEPAATPPTGTQASRAPLQADLLNDQERASRMTARIRQLEKKLSELLGEQTWQESGLGAPEDIDALKRRITLLEQTVVDLTRQLAERDEELDAAWAANRELIAQMNRRG